MVQKHNVIPCDLVMDDVAVLVGEVLEEEDRVGRSKLAPCKPEEVPIEARREVIPSGTRGALVHVFAGGGGHCASLRPQSEMLGSFFWPIDVKY